MFSHSDPFTAPSQKEFNDFTKNIMRRREAAHEHAGCRQGCPRRIARGSAAQSYLPGLQQFLVSFTARLLGGKDRAIREEEWRAVLPEFHGDITRTVTALGFLRAGLRRRARTMLRSARVFAKRCLRLGVSEEQLQQMIRDDFKGIFKAAQAGKVQITHLEDRVSADGKKNHERDRLSR